MISIDLSKQQSLDADPKPIQQNNFTGNLSRKDNQGPIINDNTTRLFIIQEPKGTVLDFSQGTVKILFFFF